MSLADDDLSPEASPDELRGGVRRVNNVPLYIAGTVLAAFIVLMVLVAIDRNRRQQAETEAQKPKGGSTAHFARELAGDARGIIPENKRSSSSELPSPAAEAVVAPPPALPTPPPIPIDTTHLDQPPARDEVAERIRQAKFQAFEDAIKAKTRVSGDFPKPAGRSGAALSADDPAATLAALRANANESFQQKLAALRAHGHGMGGTGFDEGDERPAETVTLMDPNDISRFDAARPGRWKLGSQPEAPETRYTLRTGAVLPAIMLSGINSDLPGQIMAQVSQHVYDTPTGRHLMIPQGSRLVGTYASEVAYGQERVLVAWQRVIYPDGKALDLGAMPGADGAGYAGFTDQVNQHLVRLFGSAALMSLITAGITYSQNQAQNQGQNFGYQQSASGTLSAAVGQQLGQATAALLRKNLNIAPTIEIRPGYRFNVMVSKDLAFKSPYQPFDYRFSTAAPRP